MKLNVVFSTSYMVSSIRSRVGQPPCGPSGQGFWNYLDVTQGALGAIRLVVGGMPLHWESLTMHDWRARALQVTCPENASLDHYGCHRTDVTLPHPDAIPSDQPCWLPGMSKSFLPS